MEIYLYAVRKKLAERFVLSRLNYRNVMSSQMRKYLPSRLQRIQNTAGGYILEKYAHSIDIVNLTVNDGK